MCSPAIVVLLAILIVAWWVHDPRLAENELWLKQLGWIRSTHAGFTSQLVPLKQSSYTCDVHCLLVAKPTNLTQWGGFECHNQTDESSGLCRDEKMYKNGSWCQHIECHNYVNTWHYCQCELGYECYRTCTYTRHMTIQFDGWNGTLHTWMERSDAPFPQSDMFRLGTLEIVERTLRFSSRQIWKSNPRHPAVDKTLWSLFSPYDNTHLSYDPIDQTWKLGSFVRELEWRRFY